MRYIVLRSLVGKDGSLVLYGLTSITQKASGVIDGWIDLSKASINCLAPEKCDLLSFDEKEHLESDLQLWGLNTDDIAIIGVEPVNSGE